MKHQILEMAKYKNIKKKISLEIYLKISFINENIKS